MSSPYDIPPPTVKDNKPWFSATANPARTDDGLYEYCQYCLGNFRQYHHMLNNVCQSCGRAAYPVIKDKQDNIRVTSINSGYDTEDDVPKAIGLELDYSPMQTDPTTAGIRYSDTRMKASSIGEATRKIWEAEQSTSVWRRAAELRGDKFLVKTSETKDKNKRLFDNNL